MRAYLIGHLDEFVGGLTHRRNDRHDTMTTAMQIGETARDRADFCRCFKAGTAVFLHDDGIVAHSTYGNTLRAACMRQRGEAARPGPGGIARNYALCADLTITTLSSWPACRFRLSRRMPISSRTNSYPSLNVSSPSLEMVPSRSPTTTPRRVASSSSCSASSASSELACATRSPMSRIAVASSLAFSGAILVTLA